MPFARSVGRDGKAPGLHPVVQTLVTRPQSGAGPIPARSDWESFDTLLCLIPFAKCFLGKS